MCSHNSIKCGPAARQLSTTGASILLAARTSRPDEKRSTSTRRTRLNEMETGGKKKIFFSQKRSVCLREARRSETQSELSASRRRPASVTHPGAGEGECEGAKFFLEPPLNGWRQLTPRLITGWGGGVGAGGGVGGVDKCQGRVKPSTGKMSSDRPTELRGSSHSRCVASQ